MHIKIRHTLLGTAYLLALVGSCGPGIVPLIVASPVSTLEISRNWKALTVSWTRTDQSAGYLVVRRESAAVNWSPTPGDAYTASTELGDGHIVAFAGTANAFTNSELSNSITYHYKIWSYDSSFRYAAGATNHEAPGITCPTNYLAIGPNTDLGINNPFCVAKYEMKDDGSSNAVSRATGAPWASIQRDDNAGTPGAISRCQNIGSGYDLVSNAQWQAIAREIETATNSAGVVLNWSNASTSGANAINRGHSDNSTGPLAADITGDADDDPCIGTGNANCWDSTHADFTQKRTHFLSSGEVIWDIGGNVWDWVKDDIAAGPPYEGGNNFVALEPWTTGLNHRTSWGPFGSYTSKSSGEYGGLGHTWLGYSAGGIVRGGSSSSTTNAGVFAGFLNFAPATTSGGVGFRCVSNPLP